MYKRLPGFVRVVPPRKHLLALMPCARATTLQHAQETHQLQQASHVITGPPRSAVERFRMTPDEFAAKYFPLPECTLSEGAVVVVTINDGVMRYGVELKTPLRHEGVQSDLR